MIVKIKPKLNSEWKQLHAPLFELYDGQIFVYEDYYALEDGIGIEDCTIEICILDHCIQFTIKDKCLQDLESVVK